MPYLFNSNPTHTLGVEIELQLVAQAHLVRGDLEEARRTVEAAIATPGPITENLEHDLREIERAIRFSKLERR